MKFNRIAIGIILVTSSISLLFNIAYSQIQTQEEMLTDICIELMSRPDVVPSMETIRCEIVLESQNITSLPPVNFTERALESAQANRDWLDKRMENSEPEDLN